MDPSPSTTLTDERAVARGVVRVVEGDSIVLHVAHTDYDIRLQTVGRPRPRAGDRVHGVVEAKALRIHPARGGGQFIEPVSGEPRIVAGRVLAIDEADGRVLIDSAIPMCLLTLPEQDFAAFEIGGLVNGYVESGATIALR